MKLDVNQFNRQRAKSFNEQKAMLKRLLQGREQRCSECQQPLAVVAMGSGGFKVSCQKGCTDLELEVG